MPFSYWAATRFSEGLALVGIDGVRMAYIDRAGRTAFELRAGEYGGEFREGLASVRVGLGGKYGYMDRAGRIRIPAQFDEARDYSEGLALVSLDGGYGFIDPQGRAVVPLGFDYAAPFSGGLAAVDRVNDGRMVTDAYIDGRGRVVWEKKRK